jgi:glycosyltransferase involved in cell wall biosynthesis
VVERHGCGICVDPDDVDGIAEALRYLIESPFRAREMGENGRRAVKSEYNWDTELSKLSLFYQNEILEVS